MTITINGPVIVLVDYDNLSPVQKEIGLVNLAHKVLSKIEFELINEIALCDFRIYGGWYEDNTITRLAEQVLEEINGNFPTLSILDNGLRVRINADLAKGLMEAPMRDLFNTYRKKQGASNIRIAKKEEVGCDADSCLIPALRKMFKKQKCPVNNCAIEFRNIVYRDEQKLVDTMLSCDLIYAAEAGCSVIAVVSSDDDFLPPIYAAMNRNVQVIRFLTTPNTHKLVSFAGLPAISEKEI